MKKILFMLIIAFQCFTNVKIFAQARWSNPNRDECYKGISISVVNHGKGGTGYLWGVKFKNNYSRPVQFKYRLVVGGESSAKGYWQVIRWLNPGEEWKEGESMVTAILFQNNSTSCRVETQEVCFNKDKGCFNNCYAQCDTGSPNQPNCNGNSNITSNNNQSNSNKSYNSNEQSNTEIDNLSTYLRKIPDGDSQKQQILSNFENLKNANLSDSQRASQIRILTSQAKSRVHELEGESSQKTGQYLDYYTRATNAGKSGNCDEAISNWKSAIAVAVNDVQRNNAQQWLDEVLKAKSNGQCNTVNVTNSTITTPNSTQNSASLAQENAAARAAANAEMINSASNAITGIIQAERNLKFQERRLLEKLNNSSNLNPEAIQYFNKYKKYNKMSKKWLYGGLGVTVLGGGVLLLGASNLNFGLMDAGMGVTFGGLGIMLLGGIPTSIKASINFKRAESFVASVGFKSNGAAYVAISF